MKKLHCLNCSNILSGKQTKFCSRLCKNTYNNESLQSYTAQQKRGRERKLELIKMMGGECERCHYKNNFSALEFHHINPKTKLFQLDLRSLSNRRWEVIVEEAKKCLLLCSNCHAEEHNPDCSLWGGDIAGEAISQPFPKRNTRKRMLSGVLIKLIAAFCSQLLTVKVLPHR